MIKDSKFQIIVLFKNSGLIRAKLLLKTGVIFNLLLEFKKSDKSDCNFQFTD